MSPAGYYSKKDKKDPQQDLKKLNQLISDGDFKPVHLLCGEEDYLRLQFRDKLCAAMGGVKGSLAFDRFIGSSTQPERIIDLAETLPFMAERRVILIEDTDWFKNGCQVIEEYISQGVCESTSIVFCEKDTDKRTKLYKAVAEHGLISEFPVQDVNTLASWVGSRLREAGTPISGSDAAYMVNVVGTDMLTLAAETDKLSAYCLDRQQATRADIDAICTRMLEDKVFDMCEAVAMNDKKRAMTLYYDLIALRESPIKILVLVTRQFDTLIKIKDLEFRKCGDEVIAKKIGRPSWTIAKYRKQTGRYSMSALKSIVNECADTDMAIKNGMMEDKIALETLMVRLTDSSAGGNG